MEYMDTKADPLIQIFRTHQHKTTVLQNDRNLKEKLQNRVRQRTW
jgi:hypothetical protein